MLSLLTHDPLVASVLVDVVVSKISKKIVPSATLKWPNKVELERHVEVDIDKALESQFSLKIVSLL